MTQNTIGISLRVTKTPQCRHSEKQGFVSYVISLNENTAVAMATCSNCGSDGALLTRSRPTDLNVLIEDARNALMRVEAPPLVP